MPIDGVSGNNPVQGQGRTSRVAAQIEAFKGLSLQNGANVKQITPQDAEKAFDLKPSSCVKTLLENSPVGEVYPSTEELMSKGYRIAYHKEADGSYIMLAASGDGKIILKPDAKDGTKTIVYQNDGFEQVMKYDKDGNVISADFQLRDANTGIKLGTAHMQVVNGKKVYSN